jgi:hypothetical protein
LIRWIERVSLGVGVMTVPATHAAASIVRQTPVACDTVERPAAVWWLLVVGGLTVLGLQSWNDAFYAWWAGHVNPLPGQLVLAWVFIACIPIHLGEALYVYLGAPRRGLLRSRVAWTLQTLILGYPSTRLFRKHPSRVDA